MGTPPDHEESWGAWSELARLSKRYKSIVESVKRRLTAEQQRTAVVPVAATPSSFSSVTSGSSLGLGGAFLEAAIGCLKTGLGAVVGSLWDVVSALGRVEVAAREVALNS